MPQAGSPASLCLSHVGPKAPMFSSQTFYVLGPLHIATINKCERARFQFDNGVAQRMVGSFAQQEKLRT
jgi:hypothetical protein